MEIKSHCFRLMLIHKTSCKHPQDHEKMAINTQLSCGLYGNLWKEFAANLPWTETGIVTEFELRPYAPCGVIIVTLVQ